MKRGVYEHEKLTGIIQYKMNTLEAIAVRYSCRSYKKEQITKEELNSVLQAAYEAPNADAAYEDIQLSVIQSPDALADIREIYRKASGSETADPLYGAPVFIVVSAVVPDNDPVGYANAGCVVENMALAATDLGLGNVYIYGMFDDLRLKDNHVLDTYLSLPENKTAISGIVLGYPAEEKKKEAVQGERIKTVYL